jgi:hypothetical protein
MLPTGRLEHGDREWEAWTLSSATGAGGHYHAPLRGPGVEETRIRRDPGRSGPPPCGARSALAPLSATA